MSDPKPRGAYDRLRRKPEPEAEPERLEGEVELFEAKPKASKASKASTDALADRARAVKRPPRRERKSPLYGRAADGYHQLNVRIRPEAKRKLEMYCFEHRVLMADVVEALILEHVPDT